MVIWRLCAGWWIIVHTDSWIHPDHPLSTISLPHFSKQLAMPWRMAVPRPRSLLLWSYRKRKAHVSFMPYRCQVGMMVAAGVRMFLGFRGEYLLLQFIGFFGRWDVSLSRKPVQDLSADSEVKHPHLGELWWFSEMVTTSHYDTWMIHDWNGMKW